VVDVLLAVLAVAVLVTLGVGGLLAVTVAPFLVALGHADRQGASATRVGAVAMAGSAAGLALAWVGLRADAVPAAAAVPLLLTWLVPVAVARAPRRARWLGRAGRHERLRR
jgi:hypothetical protein